MIKKIKLKNIQSHKETEIEFSKGINAIVGSSNNGKTTILRGLNWCRFNRPLGVDILISHWNMNDKGAIQDESYVEVENDKNIIIRRRTKNDNQYIVNDKKLDVVKTDIPIEVINAFNLSETNFQNQQDAPFLLSQTNGEVAKYFNKIVKLDIIDKVLTNAETSRRRTNSEIDRLEKNLKHNEEKLNNFDFLEELKNKIDECKELDEELNNLQNKIDELQYSIETFKKYKNKIYDFSNQEKLCKKIDLLSDEEKNIQNYIFELDEDIKLIKNKKVYDFKIQNRYIEKIDIIDDLKSDMDSKIYEYSEDIENYNKCLSIIVKNNDKIKELLCKLPEICPICGNKLDKNNIKC